MASPAVDAGATYVGSYVVRTLEHSMASGGYKHIILAGSRDVTAAGASFHRLAAFVPR